MGAKSKMTMIDEVVIRFGTDGWRGQIAEDYTFANVRRCAQGFASYLLSKGWAGEAGGRWLR